MSTSTPPAPKAVNAVTLSLPSTLLRTGDTVRVQTTLRDVNGAELAGRAISWSSSASDVATVSGTGLVQALTAGITTISATSEGKTGSLTLTVVRPLAVSSADSLLEPGKAFAIRGDGLRSARVSVGGTDAAILDASDSSLVVTVPAEPWSPCLAAATQLPILVTTSGEAVALTRAAAERPKVVDLAIGAYVDVPSVVLDRQCRLQLRASGTYVALPFVPVRPDTSPAPAADSIAVVVRADGASASSASVAPTPTDGRGAFSRRASSLLHAGDLPPDVVFRPSRAGAGAACPLPPLGGTVTVLSTRDSAGELRDVANSATGSDEPWTYVREGQSIAVFTDTATLRMARSNPQWGATFDRIVAISDTSLVPFLNANTRGFPDVDQNGKLIVYVSGSAPGMPTFATNWTLRAECPARAGGEAIFLSSIAGPDVPYANFAIIAHEMGHIVDFAWNEHRPLSGWAVEGFATFMQNLYAARGSPDPLVANLPTLPYTDGSGAYCTALTPTEAFPFGLDINQASYGFGCSMVGYLIALYREQKGGTTRDAITAWTHVPNTLTMEDVDSYFGVSRGASRSFGHWLLSWYADDYVSGIPPELKQPLWDIRRLWKNDVYWRSGYPMPDVVLSASTPSASFRFGAPDARYIEFTGTADAMLGVTRTGRAATTLSLLVLRAR